MKSQQNGIELVLPDLLATGHLGQEPEGLVLENVDPLVVGPQVVNLLSENGCPEVLADEFHQVQLVLEFGVLPRQLLDQSVASVVTWNKMVFVVHKRRMVWW